MRVAGQISGGHFLVLIKVDFLGTVLYPGDPRLGGNNSTVPEDYLTSACYES